MEMGGWGDGGGGKEGHCNFSFSLGFRRKRRNLN